MKKSKLKEMIMEASAVDKKRDKGKMEMKKESAEYKNPVKKATKKPSKQTIAIMKREGKRC